MFKEATNFDQLDQLQITRFLFSHQIILLFGIESQGRIQHRAQGALAPPPPNALTGMRIAIYGWVEAQRARRVRRHVLNSRPSSSSSRPRPQFSVVIFQLWRGRVY